MFKQLNFCINTKERLTVNFIIAIAVIYAIAMQFIFNNKFSSPQKLQ